MKLAIMQPYFFPYIGYFQLINAVDKFIFYDDVQYIKAGWINRNKILVNNEESIITLKLNGASSNKKINEIIIHNHNQKLLRKIKHSYQKAPFYKEIIHKIENVFNQIGENTPISKIAALSVLSVSKELELKTTFEFSSKKYAHTTNFGRTARILEICKQNNATNYINPIGGKNLYDKKQFNENKIKLQFIKNQLFEYNQFGNHQFIPGLSIIDILMFNPVELIKEKLDNYSFE